MNNEVSYTTPNTASLYRCNYMKDAFIKLTCLSAIMLW